MHDPIETTEVSIRQAFDRPTSYFKVPAHLIVDHIQGVQPANTGAVLAERSAVRLQGGFSRSKNNPEELVATILEIQDIGIVEHDESKHS